MRIDIDEDTMELDSCVENAGCIDRIQCLYPLDNMLQTEMCSNRVV